MSWPRGSHASTFGGNLAACAASLAVLELMKDKNLGKDVIEKGKYILGYLKNLQEEVELIGDVRGLGLMIGVEFVKNRKIKEPAIEERDRILKKAFENGLALLSAGESVIRLVPPLTIEKEEIDAGLEIFGKVVKSLDIPNKWTNV
jgi:4-aminobutyrate aminotransferase